jgi:TetR/AcrR family transcriptional regulator
MAFATYTRGARALLAAATSLFSDVGFDAVSMAQIAAKAGISKATVYHHFRSKEDLYFAVMKEASTSHAEFADELYESAASSASKMRQLVEFEINWMLVNRQRTRLLIREVTAGRARLRKLIRTIFRRNLNAVVRLIEQGQQRGEFNPQIDPAAAGLLLGGAANLYFTNRRLLKEYPATKKMETPKEYAGEITAVLLAGVLRHAEEGAAVPSDPSHTGRRRLAVARLEKS